ncbi:MAG TPA: PEPxxWA-CTERM sorting domain-containing protein [Qipengyuania sp.]|nr:PEPxxWA-CTERM sorting domain-containing protein [Qipengyuania sp.]
MRKSLLLAAASAMLLAAPAAAQTLAVSGFTGGITANLSGDDLPRTVGWDFTPTDNITLTDLGFFDLDGDGLALSHQIGLWASDGTLLSSTVIAAGNGAPLINGFRFVDVADLMLAAGQTYVIGAVIFEDPAGDNYFFSPSTVASDAMIGYGRGLRSGDNSGFAMPTVDPNSGRLGPNFRFLQSAIPEPSTWALLILGFGAIGSTMRVRRRRTQFAL